MKLIGSWLLLALAPVVSVVGAFEAFFLTARIVPNVTVMSLVALAVCFAIASRLAWWNARGMFPKHTAPVTWGFGIGAVLLTALLATATIFQPLASSTEAAPLPAGVRFWDLPTGSHIAYLRVPAVGAARPTPIILVHGGPGGYAVADRPFREPMSRLAQDGYDVYSYDQIGGGLSARLEDPSQYTVARHVADLEAIREKIGAPRVILIGDSWGGTLVANYMATHPDRVAKAIFTSPAPINYAEWDSFQDVKAHLPVAQQRLIENLMAAPRFLALSFLAQINVRAAHSFASDREADGFLDVISLLMLPGSVCNPAHLAADDPPNGIGFWSNLMTGNDAKSSRANPRAELAGNRTPALILTGECNYIKWQVAYQYKTTLPNSTLLYVPGAGHAIYLERPDLYFAAVRAFLLDQALPLPPYTGSEPPH